MGLPAEHRAATQTATTGENAADTGAPAPEANRRKRIIIGLGVLALVIGTSLGVIGSALRGEDPTDTPTSTDTQAGQPIPELTDKPVDTGKTPNIADPALAFEITDFRYQDGNIVAAWQDPSDGEGTFILSQTTPEKAPVQAFDFGQTRPRSPSSSRSVAAASRWSCGCPTARWARATKCAA